MSNNFSEEIEQLIKNSQVLPESYATDHTEWDESSKFMELPNRLFDRKISDLTIYEFTQLIRDIVRMELKEQISKINFIKVPLKEVLLFSEIFLEFLLSFL